MAERNPQVNKKKAKGTSRFVETRAPGTTTSLKSSVPSKYGFLHYQHAVYRANRDTWQENEELLYGGELALEYLRPFEWEIAKMNDHQSAFWWRQQQAIYSMLPEKFSTLISGHLFRSAPRADQGLDFGKLGKINAEEMTQASLVYWSCNHPGLYGMPWDAWWQQLCKRAMATGHRWVFVNAPPATPSSRRDEQFGKKPYLMDFSPLQVPNWYFDQAGDLEFIVINIQEPNPRMENGSFVVDDGEQTSAKLLLVKQGCTRLGTEFEGGGWWIFGPEDNKIDNASFDDTDGAIPCFPVYTEVHDGVPGHPAMSRAQTTELGKCAIALMNLSSAANFAAWDTAMGIEWLLGVDLEAWDLAMEKKAEGSRWLPLPPNAETDDIPQVSPSRGATDNSAMYKNREQSIWDQAQLIGLQESMGSDSGTAAGSNADFSATQMPKIIQIAMQLMAAQNMAIYFLERRFGYKNPEGQAVWPTKYNLVELADRIKAFFESERLSGLRCTPLDTEAMLQLAAEKGLIASESDKEKFRAAFIAFGEARDEIVMNGGKEPGEGQDPNSTAPAQAKRLADKKVTDGSKGSPGRPAPDK